jgi:uncharacterized phage infection (PIP) family protein YhgE
MSDRLSQLQDNVNYLASLFCDATGVLQEGSKPSKFENFADNLDRGHEQQPTLTGEEIDHKVTFTDLITTTTKEIDSIIDSLSNEDESTEIVQAEKLRNLEIENDIAAQQLENVTLCAENLLKQIQKKLSQIAESELRMHQTIKE